MHGVTTKFNNNQYVITYLFKGPIVYVFMI